LTNSPLVTTHEVSHRESQHVTTPPNSNWRGKKVTTNPKRAMPSAKRNATRRSWGSRQSVLPIQGKRRSAPDQKGGGTTAVIEVKQNHRTQREKKKKKPTLWARLVKGGLIKSLKGRATKSDTHTNAEEILLREKGRIGTVVARGITISIHKGKGGK